MGEIHNGRQPWYTPWRCAEVSRVPVYQQIASRLRYAIADGTLEPGDRLPSLRALAATWRACIHTVRRAYKTLEAQGLVETSRSGTAVAGSAVAAVDVALPTSADFGTFCRSAARIARVRFNRTSAEFASAIAATDVRREAVWTVECSGSLAGWLARQVSAVWRVDARALTLARTASVGPGLVLGTYYHFEEVRSSTPPRAQAEFLPVEVDPVVLAALRQRAIASNGRIRFVGVEEASLDAMARDLGRLMGGGPSIEAVVRSDPKPLIARARSREVVLLSPEQWDRLPEDLRRRPNVLPYMSRFRPSSLDALGTARAWAPRHGAG